MFNGVCIGLTSLNDKKMLFYIYMDQGQATYNGCYHNI